MRRALGEIAEQIHRLVCEHHPRANHPRRLFENARLVLLLLLAQLLETRLVGHKHLDLMNLLQTGKRLVKQECDIVYNPAASARRNFSRFLRAYMLMKRVKYGGDSLQARASFANKRLLA